MRLLRYLVAAVIIVAYIAFVIFITRAIGKDDAEREEEERNE